MQRVDRIKAGAPETGDEALIDYAAGGQVAPEASSTGRETVPAAKPRTYYDANGRPVQK